jgi:hypothetical protein
LEVSILQTQFKTQMLSRCNANCEFSWDDLESSLGPTSYPADLEWADLSALWPVATCRGHGGIESVQPHRMLAFKQESVCFASGLLDQVWLTLTSGRYRFRFCKLIHHCLLH